LSLDVLRSELWLVPVQERIMWWCSWWRKGELWLC